MVWAGFCAFGKLVIEFVYGTLNVAAYIDLLERRLLPFSADCVLRNVIFQQDNAPAHSASSTKNWFEQQKIAVLP